MFHVKIPFYLDLQSQASFGGGSGSGSGGGQGFVPQNQQAPQPTHGGFNYQQNFPGAKPAQQQPPMMHPPFQQNPNMYPPQNINPHYMPPSMPPGFQHPSAHPMGGSGFFQPQTTQGIANQPPFGSILTPEYSENDREFEKVIEHIANLKYPEKREEALGELSKKRESFPQLAVYLWHSVGTLAVL